MVMLKIEVVMMGGGEGVMSGSASGSASRLIGTTIGASGAVDGVVMKGGRFVNDLGLKNIVKKVLKLKVEIFNFGSDFWMWTSSEAAGSDKVVVVAALKL